MLLTHLLPEYCENVMHESLAQEEQNDRTCDMNILGMWAWLTNTKEIQIYNFVDTSKKDIDLLVNASRPKHQMDAVEIKLTGKPTFCKVFFINLSRAALTRLEVAEGEGPEGATQPARGHWEGSWGGYHRHLQL